MVRIGAQNGLVNIFLCLPKCKGGMGFHNFEWYNVALLAKQAQRILIEPDALWVRLLRRLYYPNSDFLLAPKGHGLSRFWRSMICAREHIQQGLRVNIGNGTHTQIWEDKWVPSLKGFCIYSYKPQNIDLFSVSNLIQGSSRTWRMDLLQSLFSPTEVKAISTIPISTKGLHDSNVWYFTKNGMYSSHSSYMFLSTKFLRTYPTLGFNVNWVSIWKLPLPPKIQVFVQKSFWQVLPLDTYYVAETIHPPHIVLFAIILMKPLIMFLLNVREPQLSGKLQQMLSGKLQQLRSRVSQCRQDPFVPG